MYPLGTGSDWQMAMFTKAKDNPILKIKSEFLMGVLL